jgi:hypothetical protein
VHTHDRKRDDKKLIKDLKEKFEKQGCLRLEESAHRIPATVDQATLIEAIQISPKADQNTLLENPKKGPPDLGFPPGSSIECHQGRLRIEAAKEFLPRHDWWWTIDLYLKGLSLCSTTI